MTNEKFAELVDQYMQGECDIAEAIIMTCEEIELDLIDVRTFLSKKHKAALTTYAIKNKLIKYKYKPIS